METMGKRGRYPLISNRGVPGAAPLALLLELPSSEQFSDMKFDGVAVGLGLSLGTGDCQAAMFSRNQTHSSVNCVLASGAT